MRRDFDDPGFNLDNGKAKAVFLNSLMSGYTELIEISDCRRIEECRSAGALERPEPGGVLRQFRASRARERTIFS